MIRDWNRKLICVVMAVILLFACTSCNAEGEAVVITCNGLSITESTFMLLLTEQALAIADDETITQETLVERAKQEVLAYIPAYTYYVQGYKEAKYTLSEDDRGTLRANALAALLENDFSYDSKNRDEVFLQTFGATFEQYMKHQEETYLISYFYQQQLDKIEVEESLTKSYFAEHQADYAICTAQILRYPASEAGEATAALAAQKWEEGGSFDECKQYTGWEKAEILTFDYTSNLDDSFGEGFVNSMVTAKEGMVRVLKTDTCITVAKLTVLSGYTENLKEIQQAVKEELFAQKLDEIVGTERYIPKIVNQEIYDGITELPGGETV